MKYKVLVHVRSRHGPDYPALRMWEDLRSLRGFTWDRVEWCHENNTQYMPEREEHGEAIIEFFHKFALANHLTEFVVQSSGSYEVMGAKARASTIIKHLEELKKRCQREDLGYEITEIIQDKDGIEVKSSL